MTLYRRLSITLTMAILICAGSFGLVSIYSLHTAHQHLASERSRHAADFFKYLFLTRAKQTLQTQTLSEPASVADLPGAALVTFNGWSLAAEDESHLTTLMQRSLLQNIVIIDSTGTELWRFGPANNDGAVADLSSIPSWLVRWLPLDDQAAVVDLSLDVQRLASLKVVPDLPRAYQQLWINVRSQIVLICWISLSLVLLLQASLYVFLNPLRQLVEQGQQLIKHQWQQQVINHLPGDLKSLQASFHTIIDRLKDLWIRQLQLIDQLYYDNYHDPLSGLLNRRGFDHRLEHVQQHHESQHGLLMIVQLCNLNRINQGHGRRAGDDVISALGKLIKHWQHEHPNSFCGRHSATDITLYTPCSDINQAQDILQQTYTRISLSTALQQKDLTFYIGGFYFADNNLQVTRVMSQADAALDVAKRQVDRRLHLVSEEDSASELLSSQQWPELLQDIAQQGSLRVKFRPTVALHPSGRSQSTPINSSYLTAVAYLPGPSGELSMARYWPLVEHHQLTVEFDLCLLEQALIKLTESSPKADGNASKLVVSISPASLVDERFYQNISQLIRQYPCSHDCLILQVPEFCIAQYQASLVRLAYILEPFNIGLAVYQVINSQALQLSQVIPLAFIEIDSRYCRAIHHLPEQCFMVKSIVQAARYRDIPVFINGVADESEYHCIHEIGIVGASGRFVAAEQESFDLLADASANTHNLGPLAKRFF